MRYELRNELNELVNTIVLDDFAQWPVPAGHTLIELPEPEPPEPTLDDLKTQRKDELAALRYQHETASITLNGATIKTDRESQALVNGAYSYSLLNPAAMIDWKAETGWIQIDATAIAGIAGAVAAHVQACFSNERTLAEAIAAAESVEAVQAIDLSVGWP